MRRLPGLAALLLGAALLGAPHAIAAPAAPLDGLFQLSPGVCSGGSVTGSFFRMILPTGNASGPYLSNSDSRCSDQTVTPLFPGTDGGLLSGHYQPQPAAAFDATGNARSGSVTTPVRFYGVDFATATNPTDPQTSTATGTPQLYANGGELTGDLSGLGVTWNNQVFNQGSPKPGGSFPGKTSPVHGSIDSAGNFVIEWTSQIVGGPFNNFTGLWHLAGQYKGSLPGAVPAPAAPAPAAPGPSAPPIAGAPPAAAPAQPAPGGSPSEQPAASSTRTVRTVAMADRGTPVWLVPALIVVALAGVAVFCNAGRLATALSRRRGR